MRYPYKTTCLSLVGILLLISVTAIGSAKDEEMDQGPSNIITLVFSVPDPKIFENSDSVSVIIEGWGSSHSTGYAILPQRSYFIPVHEDDIPFISGIRAIGSRQLQMNQPVDILRSPIANGYSAEIHEDPDTDICINLGQVKYGHCIFLILRMNPFSLDGLKLSYPEKIEVDLILTHPPIRTNVVIPENLPEPADMESDDNPPIPLWDMAEYSPDPKPAASGSYTTSHPPIQMAIITTSAMNSTLQELAEWKTKRGVYTAVYEMGWISTNVTGSDNASKIRKLLTDLWKKEDLQFAILGGDYEDVPSRQAYVPDGYDDSGTSDGSYLPTDYYYADLDGTGHTPYDWDGDNDSLYGEYSDDGIDLNPEIYVGRLSASNSSNMLKLVNNIINYEKSPPNGSWFNRSTLAASYSNYETKETTPVNDTTDDADLKEAIRKKFIDSENYTVFRLYEKEGVGPSPHPSETNLNISNMVDAIDNGTFMVNMAGHGSYSGIYRSIWYRDRNNDGYCQERTELDHATYYTTAVTQKNGGMKPLFYNDACNNGEFDREWCLTEDILRDVGIGAVGASRVSWYNVNWTPGSDGGYYNQGQDYRFWEQFFSGYYQPGKALYKSKYDYIADKTAHDSAAWKNLLQYNLMGDPEIKIWTQTPDTFNVTYSDPLPAPGNYTFLVKDSSGDPVENARICLMNGSNFYGYCDTNSTGYGTIELPEITMNLSLTVTGHNFEPYERNVSSYVRYYKHSAIQIEGDSGFTEANGVRSGNGTEMSPYIIESWEINGTGTGRGLYIGNTTAHFIIRDCLFHNASGNSGDYYWNAGLILVNISNGQLFNNTITNNTYGILLRNCSTSNNIENNTCIGNSGHGLYVRDSDNNEIINNSCVLNGNHGIIIRNSNNNTVANNNCSSNSYCGILNFENGNNNTISNNSCRDNLYGLYTYTSSGLRILDNNLSNNEVYGFYSRLSGNQTITGNNIYFNEGQGILMLYSNNNTYENNTCIGNSGHGFYTMDSDDNYISNCVMSSNSHHGIYIRSSYRNILELNNCSSNSYYGILNYDNANNNTISNNSCRDNLYGLYIHTSSGLRILDNNLSNNEVYGFYSRLSGNQTITGNNIYFNDGHGILMLYSNNNTHENNTCIGNSGHGFYTMDSDDNYISNCVMKSNSYHGIFIRSSSRNILELNNCSSNSYYGILNYGNANNNTINNNSCKDNYIGLYTHTSYDLKIVDNNLSDNDKYGLYSVLSENQKITGNEINFNIGHGIYMLYSNNNTVNENKCINNTLYGIFVRTSDDNLISNNLCSYNYKSGIYLRSYSTNNNLVNNTCTGNSEIGLYMRNSDDNRITNCTMNSNSHYGIYIRSSSGNIFDSNNCSYNEIFGFILYGGSHWNTISNNTVWNNSYGLYLYSSGNNTIEWNEIRNNSGYGAALFTGSNDNIVNNNSFIDNNNGGTQGYDSGTNNDWDDGSFGNYWSDYASRYPSATNDGTVWNTPYTIAGTAGSKDPKPLVTW